VIGAISIQKKGKAGLVTRVPNKDKPPTVYTGEFRIAVVKEKIESNISYSDLAKKHGINRPVIQMWVSKYLEKGEEILAVSMTGKRKAGKKSIPKTKLNKRQKKDVGKEVIAELASLRAEVAYLKKFNALAWEKIELQKKRKLK